MPQDEVLGLLAGEAYPDQFRDCLFVVFRRSMSFQVKSRVGGEITPSASFMLLRVGQRIRTKSAQPIGRHLSVAKRVLDVLVPEISLQRPDIAALISQHIAAGMPKHLRMDRKR